MCDTEKCGDCGGGCCCKPPVFDHERNDEGDERMITVDGNPMGKPVSQTDAELIIDWLRSAFGFDKEETSEDR